MLQKLFRKKIAVRLALTAALVCSNMCFADQQNADQLVSSVPPAMADGITAATSRELARYVSMPDPSFSWRQLHAGHVGRARYCELILTSQTWRGIPWKHQLFVLRPAQMHSPVKQVFLFIHGGRWKASVESAPRTGALPREAKIFALLAESIGAPVAVLRQVPFQPLFERTEDALIAHTFDRFLKTGEPDWPLLLPMVKSATRAMDAVQAHLRGGWEFPVESFTVAGASKRGWTSWLTAAVDPRVTAVAPMVIDMLNFPAQIELQRTTFGGLSEQVRDYEEIGLAASIDTAPGRRLLQMVDPYSYRDRLAPAKLILLATNDRYWPLDALKLYWKDLPAPKSILYVPNQGHGVRDVKRLISTLSAFHRYSARGAPLPALKWNFVPSSQALSLQINADHRSKHVVAWTASSPTRDFRSARWTSHRCKGSEDRYVCHESLAPDRYTALYAEVQFRQRHYPPFSLSTGVCIVAGSTLRSTNEAMQDCEIE